MKMAVFQLVLCSEQEVFKEPLKKLVCRMDAALQIVIIGTHQSVAEILGILRKHVVVHCEAKIRVETISTSIVPSSAASRFSRCS